MNLRILCILFVIVLVAMLLRLPQALSLPLWIDEALTWRDSEHELDMIRWLHSGAHPPLSYLLVNASRRLTGSDAPWALRLPSLLAGLAMIPLLFLAGKRLRSSSCGLAAAGLGAIHPELIAQSQQARMYSLYGVLLLLLIIHLTRPPENGKPKELWWHLLAILLASIFWTWGFAFIPIAALVVTGVLYWQHERRAGRVIPWPSLRATGISCLLFLALCHVGLLTAGRNLLTKWLRGDPGPSATAGTVYGDLAELLWAPYGPPGLWLGLALIAAAVWLKRAWQTGHPAAYFCLAIPLANLCFLSLVHAQISRVQPRYLLSSSLVTILGLALAIDVLSRQRSPGRRWGVHLLIATLLIFTLPPSNRDDLEPSDRALGAILQAHDPADKPPQLILVPEWMSPLLAYYGFTPETRLTLDHVNPDQPLWFVSAYHHWPALEPETRRVYRKLMDRFNVTPRGDPRVDIGSKRPFILEFRRNRVQPLTEDPAEPPGKD